MEDSVEQENSAELVPNVVIYCKICKMPAEYCVNGSTLPECQAWLSETHVDLCKRLYPELEITEGISQVEVNEDAEAPAKSTKGNKVPKKKAVVIRVVDRTKRKRLELFDVDLKKAAKLFAGKFACGSAVTKLASGTKEIHIQGEFSREVFDLIRDTFKIKEKEMSIAEPKKK